MSMAFQVPPAVLESLSPKSRSCIENLGVHQPGEIDISNSAVLAAVLVLLYEKSDELRVLLTTRSKLLRAHPGETALPGGKVDKDDASLVFTAFREANEEVGLPRHSPSLYTVSVLRPFLSNRKVVVRPVIALLGDLSLLDKLKANEAEVAHIFDHPLEAIIDPILALKESLVGKGSTDWPYEEDLHNTDDRRLAFLGDATYRMHRFRSTASPIKGLTAEILMTVAEVAYARPPTFERYAPEQMTDFTAVLRALEQAEQGEQVHASGTSTPIGVATNVSHGGT
ncbi:uncharacterized protein C8Q71DRAFT_704772 [Rhodofomes roseus]|uniref:Nudix hydrolase domain-containing protein n=1 Tax=Rhodofomes roseus TaxID=34475 RepID=A0A4Y9Y7H6_9APHY|nr:uncharacterized protein C8Q71DRAFT_704772 [Rhodofomes roseus]KAH9838694.1 hypothetical protein C8Q71DRAFT_704772 [Rhodofomes roseus]TFY58456.1 hypothetical protein EVJ58_g6406 [Rhodofomes roseus]